MYRLGYTESTLLFYFYLDNIHFSRLCSGESIQPPDYVKNMYINCQNDKVSWLYRTSGFYDKSVNTNNYQELINSNIYKTYFYTLLNYIKEYNGKVLFNFTETIINELKDYKPDFFTYINKEDNKNTPRDSPDYGNIEFIYKSIENKNIVIINNNGELMKSQYLNGNLHSIYDNVPFIKNIDVIKPNYTFFNNGPRESILESVNDIYSQIDKLFDNCSEQSVEDVPIPEIFIISSGAYSILIAHYIHVKYNVKVIIIGGDLPSFFGVNTERGKKFYRDIHESKKQYFIDVPEELKPLNYKQIEDGCYW